MIMTLTPVTSKEQFSQEVTSASVVLIDFYADWCGPCRMLSPIMEELQEENISKGVKILKVNIDEQQDLAEEFGVTTIPTIFFAHNGEIKEGVIGVNEKEMYQEKINIYLG